MLILKKDRKVRNVLMVALVFAFALFVDADFSSPASENSQEARFLGIGRLVKKSPCIYGQRNVFTSYTFLWIRIGRINHGIEAC